VHTLDGHGGRVTALAFSGAGVYAASSNQDGTITLEDARSGQELSTFQKSVNEVILNHRAF